MVLAPIDRQIIEAAQQGDEAAFAKILGHYEQPVYRYILRMVSRPADAEDLTQETFIKVYFNLASFDPARRFSTWLFTIATNTVYDWLRKRRGRPELLYDQLPETTGSQTTYTSIGSKFDIMTALQKLRVEYRAVLLLYFDQGYSYQEIAETMNLPINTVKTYLFRAKAMMRQLLEPKERTND